MSIWERLEEMIPFYGPQAEWARILREERQRKTNMTTNTGMSMAIDVLEKAANEAKAARENCKKAVETAQANLNAVNEEISGLDTAIGALRDIAAGRPVLKGKPEQEDEPEEAPEPDEQDESEDIPAVELPPFMHTPSGRLMAAAKAESEPNAYVAKRVLEFLEKCYKRNGPVFSIGLESMSKKTGQSVKEIRSALEGFTIADGIVKHEPAKHDKNEIVVTMCETA